MARVIAVVSGTKINSTVFGNALITDYFSQTDTNAQAIASNVTGAAAKILSFPTVKADTISERTGAGTVAWGNDQSKGTTKAGRTLTLTTLGVAATTFAVAGEAMQITGHVGANTVATITGGRTGQILILVFVDALVTITDTDGHTANTVDLSAAFTSADDKTLTLFFDGTSWYELARSSN